MTAEQMSFMVGCMTFIVGYIWGFIAGKSSGKRR